MDSLFNQLSELLGNSVAPDHLKLVFSILFTYPCALLLKRQKSANVKHLMSIIYTTFVMLRVLKLYDGFIHISSICIITFTLTKYFRQYKATAWINFFCVMASMAICHIGRQLKGIEGDTQLDYSGALMIATIKLSSFGYNVLDGHHTITNSKLEREHIEKMKVVHFPTLLQYFGWCFFFGGFLAGPTCEYMDYIRFIEPSPTSTPEEDQTRYMKTTPAIKKFCKSFGFMLALVYLAPTFNYSQALSPLWKQKPFYEKMMFIQLSAVLTRCKYYFIWTLSEGACNLAGFGFDGYDKDGKARWSRLTNSHFLKCEFAQSLKQLTENWNMGANHWLRHYVYLRYYPLGSTLATLITYVISSMWHGFHPGFYIFFMTGSLLQLISRQVRRVVRPFFLNKFKPVYDVATWIFSMGLLNMLVPCFDLLHVPLILEVWRGIYYCHFIIIFIGTLLFYCARPLLVAKQQQKDIVKEKSIDDIVESLEVMKNK